MISLPLSLSIPLIGKGNSTLIPVNAANTHRWALFRTVRFSVHPRAMSVTVRVEQKSPEELPPSCPTRSISTKPGTASSHSAQVRIGIASLSSEPGLVCERPCGSSLPRSGANRRSIVAADIRHNAAAVRSWMSSSPQARSRATSSGRNGANRLPAGAPSTAQQNRSAAITSSP